MVLNYQQDANFKLLLGVHTSSNLVILIFEIMKYYKYRLSPSLLYC